MGATPAETAAMRRALQIAANPGVPLGPNPRVGCVLLADDGTEVAEGFHRGAGTPHAEVAALTEAGDAARGATAVVTLEPCNHTGRTGPCVEALLAAGVRRVVFAQPDPNPEAAGGAEALRAAGVEVEAGVLADEAARLNRAWTFAVHHERPFVTWKLATTLDGRSAAADGTSRWISSEAARQDTHRLRAECDVLLVGTRTVEVDDPLLTVRDNWDRPVRHQPLRAVMGLREIRPTAGSSTTMPRRSTCAPASPPRPCATSTTAAVATCGWRAGPPWPPRSCLRTSSTRLWPTWRPACSAPGRARWATWASPPSPTSSASGSGRRRSSAPEPTPTCD